jgi:hypothetical protein
LGESKVFEVGFWVTIGAQCGFHDGLTQKHLNFHNDDNFEDQIYIATILVCTKCINIIGLVSIKYYCKKMEFQIICVCGPNMGAHINI